MTFLIQEENPPEYEPEYEPEEDIGIINKLAQIDVAYESLKEGEEENV